MQLLLTAVRSGGRAEQDALEVHERMTAVKIRVLGDRVSRHTAWRIAVEHDWEALRDAEHLAVVRLQADALVTVDPALAARAVGIVPTAPCDVLFSHSGREAAPPERPAGEPGTGRVGGEHV